MADSYATYKDNIIENYDFSRGLHCWHPNSCRAYVASKESGFPNGISAHNGERYAVLTERTECWHGLEQDITGKVIVGTTYTLSAFVRVCGDLQGPTEVQATLRLEYPSCDAKYLSLGR